LEKFNKREVELQEIITSLREDLLILEKITTNVDLEISSYIDTWKNKILDHINLITKRIDSPSNQGKK